MTVLVKRATSFVDADFSNTGNAVDGGTGTYATWVNSSRRGSSVGTFSGLDFSSIPGNATINSVTLSIRHYISAGAAGDFSDVTETSSGLSVTPTATAAIQTIALPASIPSSIELTFNRGNNTRSTTYSLDYVEVSIDYDVPIPTGTGSLSATTTLAGAGNLVTPVFSGTGNISATCTLAGSGFDTEIHDGTGDIAASVTLAGSGEKIPDGTGNLTATCTLSGTGAPAAPVFAGTGHITATAALSGSGELVPPVFSEMGSLSATVTLVGTGKIAPQFYVWDGTQWSEEVYVWTGVDWVRPRIYDGSGWKY